MHLLGGVVMALVSGLLTIGGVVMAFDGWWDLRRGDRRGVGALAFGLLLLLCALSVAPKHHAASYQDDDDAGNGVELR